MEEKDGHIASEMGKRRRALILDWEITAPDNASAQEKRNAEQLGELVQSIPDFEDVIRCDRRDRKRLCMP
jgi:phage gp29-like protein